MVELRDIEKNYTNFVIGFIYMITIEQGFLYLVFLL